LAVDKVIVKLKGKVVFKQYIPKKRKHFGIKSSNNATLLDIHMTWMFTLVKTGKKPDSNPHHSD